MDKDVDKNVAGNMAKDRIGTIIEGLGLMPLPREGGYFRFITRFGSGAGTIYYLMTEDNFSHMHALTDDEVWYFLEGDEVEQTLVGPDNKVRRILLNENNRVNNVPAGFFQATRIRKTRLGYALVCTAMSPAYRDDMYTHGADCSRISSIAEIKDLL